MRDCKEEISFHLHIKGEILNICNAHCCSNKKEFKSKFVEHASASYFNHGIMTVLNNKTWTNENMKTFITNAHLIWTVKIYNIYTIMETKSATVIWKS